MNVEWKTEPYLFSTLTAADVTAGHWSESEDLIQRDLGDLTVPGQGLHINFAFVSHDRDQLFPFGNIGAVEIKQ